MKIMIELDVKEAADLMDKLQGQRETSKFDSENKGCESEVKSVTQEACAKQMQYLLKASEKALQEDRDYGYQLSGITSDIISLASHC